MKSKVQRTRKGCLTCRARRIKCDEGKPSCERCNASNIECLGYEQKRRIEARASRRSSTPQMSVVSAVPVPQPSIILPDVLADDADHVVQVRFREDGLPLAGLPNNPLPSQRPHSAARNLLFYHQFLFRTLPVLFPVEHHHFWRDGLCEVAWETEYVYDTIMSLGGMHRATLMMSMTGENDRSRGLDTRVIAVQAYTRALQELSEHLDEAEASLDILVGVFLLLAYVECFAGNIPATFRHVMVANQYFSRLLSQSQLQMIPIESCLQKFGLLGRILLPLPRTTLSLPQPRAWSQDRSVLTLSPNDNPSTTSSTAMLQTLIDLGSESAEIEKLIWNQLPMYERKVSRDRICAFQKTVKDWKSNSDHQSLLPSDFERTISSFTNLTWNAIEELPIPPQPYPIVSSKTCLTATLYCFYMARSMWLLSLLGCDSERHELSAYIYAYEVMRWSATASNKPRSTDKPGDALLSCETLSLGFIPMLHIIGQNSPRQTWVRWIMEQLKHFKDEGFFNGKVFARSLHVLHAFEMCNSIDSPSVFERFPSPNSRVIAVMIPEENGRGFTAYYASPVTDGQHAEAYHYPYYYPLGQARWSNVLGNDRNKPDVQFYNKEEMLSVPFTEEWLSAQKVARDWTGWVGETKFDLDSALRDHINGSTLSPFTVDTQT